MSVAFEFWPAGLTTGLPESPLLIMKKAAAELGKATSGSIEGQVSLDSRNSDSSKVCHDFYLVAKALNFKHLLFWAKIDAVSLYPVEVCFGDGLVHQVNDASEMAEAVRSITRSDSTIRIVKALIAQSTVLS